MESRLTRFATQYQVCIRHLSENFRDFYKCGRSGIFIAHTINSSPQPPGLESSWRDASTENDRSNMAIPQPQRDHTKDGKPIMHSDLKQTPRITNDLSSIWICLGCGYHHMDNNSPDCCPRCTGTRILSAFGDTSD